MRINRENSQPYNNWGSLRIIEKTLNKIMIEVLWDLMLKRSIKEIDKATTGWLVSDKTIVDWGNILEKTP